MAGGVDHLCTALKWLPDNIVLKGTSLHPLLHFVAHADTLLFLCDAAALAVVVSTAAGHMVYAKVKTARDLENLQDQMHASAARASAAAADTTKAEEAQEESEAQRKDFMAYMLHVRS
jgi:hypothetical protein